MARRVVADTGFLVALLDSRDHLNSAAIELSRQLAGERAPLLTTDAVLLEFANYFARGPLRREAARWIAAVRADPGWSVSPLDRHTLLKAEARYARHADKNWSLTDCHTMEVMRAARLRDIATPDFGFAQAGFRCLLPRS